MIDQSIIDESSSDSSVSIKSIEAGVWKGFRNSTEWGTEILAPPRRSKYDAMTWIPAPEVESSNNQPHPLDEESILESSMNRVCVRLDMVDEKDRCEEELLSKLYRKPAHHVMPSRGSCILLPSNFGSPFFLSKRLQIKTIIFPWCIIGLWSSDHNFSLYHLIILINALVI